MITVGLWSLGLTLCVLGAALLGYNLGGWPDPGRLADLWGLIPLFLGLELLAAAYRSRRRPTADPGGPPVRPGRIRLHGGALAGLAALVLVAALANVAAADGGWPWRSWWNHGPGPQARASAPVNLTAGAAVDDSLTTVVVEAPPGQWTVTGADASQLTVDGNLTVFGYTTAAAEQAARGARMQINLEGSRAVVTVVVPGYDPANPASSVRPVVGGAITVPRRLSLIFHSGTADVSVSGLDGDVDIDTSTGQVEAKQVKGNLTIHTATGNISAKDVGGRVDLTSSTGYVEVARVAGEVTVDTNTGWVRVTDPGAGLDLHLGTGGCTVTASAAVAGNWSIRTTTGYIEVTFPSSSNVTIAASTRTGALSTNLGLAVETTGGRKSMSGTLGSGEFRIELEASTGAVTVEGAEE